MGEVKQGAIKVRSPYWDNIKGFLIILVVFAHCIYGLQTKHVNSALVQVIYYFHMPAFVFVSGYFSKSRNASSTGAILKLVVACLLFSIPFVIRDFMRGDTVQYLTPYFSAWYLVALIIWRLLTPYLAKFRYILPVIVIFSLIAGFCSDISSFSVLAIKKVIVFYPYFLAGYLLSKESVDKRFKCQSLPKRIGIGGMASVAALAVMYFANDLFKVEIGDLLPNAYREMSMNEVFIRMSVLLVSFLAILAIMMLASDRKIPVLTSAGRNSLCIYLTHRIICLLYSGSDYVIGLQARYQLAGAVILTAAIVLIFGSEIFSRWLNNLINNCADALNPGSGNTPKTVYKVFILGLIVLYIIVPVILDMSM